MGWASGSDLFDKVIRIIKEEISSWDELPPVLVIRLIDAFEDEDCDTLDESEFPEVQRVIQARYTEDGELTEEEWERRNDGGSS